MLGHLACVLATALLFFGDPRFRTPYDVFALALLAALIAHRLFDRDVPSAPVPSILTPDETCVPANAPVADEAPVSKDASASEEAPAPEEPARAG